MSDNLPDTWDPKEGSRSWYRNAATGDRGYVVRRDGKAMIRLDRPHQEILKRLDETWIEEDATRPLSPIHIARICFEADRALCAALGDMQKARADWQKLTDHQRQAWITQGPARPAQRAVLYSAIRQVMEVHGRS